MNDIFFKIKSYLTLNNTNDLFVHTDISKGFKVAFNSSKNDYIAEHIQLLLKLNCNLLIPVYNYNFSKSKVFDVVNDTSQVGVINEYFRKNFAQWQTPIPFFSVAGTGRFPEINLGHKINVFDDSSIWSHLYNNDSAIMYYGASFSCTTIIHFVEEISSTLRYRYSKRFDGEVILSTNEIKKICINMHVRPLNYYLGYDWVKLECDLFENNIIKQFKDGLTDIKIINVKKLVDFWLNKLYENELYFLDNNSVFWVKPMLNKLKRPFELTDFEK
jgi:aminoglycoside N3'-acetyltransferase